jgi:hypothetical protein
MVQSEREAARTEKLVHDKARLAKENARLIAKLRALGVDPDAAN